MNMKKTMGICATLLAALLCALPQSAQATGKIRAVDVYKIVGGEEVSVKNVTFKDVGETIYIRFRLANVDWGVTATNSTYTCPWSFVYSGTLTGNETLDELQRLAANKPRLGLWVSGDVREVECANFLQDTTSDWLSGGELSDGGKHYSDIIFKYVVQAGDFALPIQFANMSGSGPATDGQAYYLKCNKKPVQWELRAQRWTGEWVTSEFAFGPSNLEEDGDFDFQYEDMSSWLTASTYERDFRDITLSQTGVFVQTIDFDGNYRDEDAGIWREIAQGSTTASPVIPAFAVAGGAAEPIDHLYVWAADPTVAEIVKGGQVDTVVEKLFADGTTRKVGTIKFPAGEEGKSVPFYVKAVGAKDATTEILLAATPTNIYKDAISPGVMPTPDQLVTNFIFRTIRVGEPLPPNITVSVNNKSRETVTAPTNDYSTALVAVNVTLSQAWEGPGNLQVPIKVTVKDDPSLNATNYVRMSTEDANHNEDWVDVLEVNPGATSATLPLWMYANRGSIETEGGLLVEVNTNDTRWTAAARNVFERFNAATVVVNRSTPGIAYIQDLIRAEANTWQEVTVKVDDAWGELRPPCEYTVYWSPSGNDSPAYYTTVVSNLSATASGDITFKVKYSQKGDYVSRFYVVNQDGKESARHIANVHVDAQQVVEATVVQKRFAEDSWTDQPAVTLTFGETGFKMPGDSENDYGYVFFVPKSENASNLVYCTDMDLDGDFNNKCDWKAGYLVGNGDPSLGPIDLTLLDGSKRGLTMEYDIVVRTDEDFDSGSLVGTWSSKGFSFVVTNVVPNVIGIKMGAEELYASGGNLGSIALGLTRQFSAYTDEVSEEDLYADKPDYTNHMESFETEWKFKLGQTTLYSTNIFGPPAEKTFNYTFKSQGDYTVEVRMRDKDMDHNRNEWGPVFTFNFTVDEKPYVNLTAYEGTTAFNELQPASETRFDVDLSLLPSEEIAVALTVARAQPYTGEDSKYPLPTLSTSVLRFGGDSPNTTHASFTITKMDGTDGQELTTASPGFVIYAAVTNTNRNADGVMWTNVYRMAELPITIENRAPVILTKPDTNEVEKAVNTPFEIPYSFSDNAIDMAAGEELYWEITGEDSTNFTVRTSSSRYQNKFRTMFTSAGKKTIQLTVVDKDGWASEIARWFFVVKPSKRFYVIPSLPGSPAADVAAKWAGQKGIGAGRVWVEEGAMKSFSRFRHVYTYAPAVPSAFAFAHGYSGHDIDNGSLTPGMDFAVTMNGSHPATGNYFDVYTKYGDGKDSFFYVWLLSASEDGGDLTTTVKTPAPAFESSSDSPLTATLPKEEKDATSYPDTFADAIFSKEYRLPDNLGDINGDGIPDIYAVNPIYGGQRLYEIAGGSKDDGGDLIDFENYNVDGDYLPSRSFEGGLPNTANGWTTLGVPFTAYWEVRGFHEGLNHRRNHGDNGLNLYVAGAWVSEPCFSEAETNAVAKWNKVQWNGAVTTWADFKAAVPTDDPDYATKLAEWQTAFTNALYKNDSWIPEKRTNPTLWDTDGDSLPDGYEYYFWYRAAVGEMKDGKWVQTTGEKFTLNNIAKGTPLSAEDIMKAFDPTVRASGDNIAKRDTDNDGLTDIEEFAMGTNPVHWDSDGDGMSDLWEVMRGMNPLKKPTEPEKNVDGDFMARALTPSSYAIVTLNNGKVYALEQNGTNLKTFERDSFDADDGTTKGGTNVLSSVVFGVEDVSNVTAIAVFHYSNDSSSCVPKKRGNPNEQVKPLDPDEVSLADTEVVSIKINQQLMLIHDQVYNQHEFHPFTGWFVNANGDVSDRWGPAVNTIPYTAIDEYLVMKYRYETGIATPDNERTLSDLFLELTTNPNKPFTDAAYTVTWAGTDGGGSEQVASVASIPTFTSGNHGADTDEDGIPDGWELYVGANPNDYRDAAGGANDDDLSLRNEYAGSDSCNAYQDAVNADGVATIYQYHPGNAKGWFNKFTPTDPGASDTDKDGLSDGREGSSFIYGDPTDDGSRCIRGGGLNPCGVDTDFDLLPDGWERQYQGTVVPAGTGFEGIHPDIVQIIKRNDNLGSNAVIRAYISFGMDGTYNDAFKVPTSNQVDPRTGTRRNLDFDNDGLHNFQEYLVQVLRHLRYDDTETPLMGSYLPNGIAGTRKYIGFVPMQVWDGSTFFRTARAAGFTGLSARQGDGFKFRELGYFAPPEKTWDLTMSGSRLLKPPRGLSDIATADDENRMGASRYVGTDPRDWDTDRDGMDDYYELFHGLNPLLGSKDIISEAYNTILSNEKMFSARCTAWSNWQETELVYDAMRFPWAMGVAEADADGDGLRNTDEALLVNMPNPKNYHTDPTPLWMTDTSSKISVTAQYYCRDSYKTGTGDDGPNLSSYFWFNKDLGGIDGRDPGGATDFMFTFEENEGYDTDHDWIPDEQELTHAVTAATSPLHGSDPDRRQAMYFPGAESVVQTYSGNLNRRIGENYAMLRAFSVEAWVRPEDLSREQTIVTRVCNYPSSTLSNATHQVRANFRLKMEAGGRVWGEFDSDDAVPNGSPKGFGTTTVEGNTLESNKWSHVALTFDGNELILYINGRDIHRSYSNLIPANGLVVTLQEVNPNGSNYGVDGYTNYPSALLIGADAKELGALDIGTDSAWTNYCAHYKGWVDEVRVWDGARTQAEIQADMLKRYTLKDVSDLRSAVYKEWLNGGTHNPNDGRPNLPTELVFHYGFQQLPSEIEADYVASEPSGFTERVLDNVKWNGRSVDIRCGWWNAVPIASTVYGNRAIVPWVRDTCAMLPALDGSSYDSRYWSELIGGVTFPTEVNVQTFQFPNVANPYPYWNYMAETFFREQRLNWMRGSVGAGLSSAADDVYNRLRFGNRTLFVGGSDLLPLGGAFMKRCPDFWDGHGATDAWTATVDDTDDDGLPDWWEAHAAAEYGADAATLTTKTKISYKLPSGVVVEMSAWEAYQIDLARGIMPGVPATYDPAYESLADNNNDGLPDWWQKLYDVYDLDPDEDPDNDGLSIYQEWQISWDEANGFGVLNGYPFLSPTKARSGDAQEVTDYFLKSTTAPYEGYYLGEIVADFDMMEDGFEDFFGTDDTVFDAWSDYDEDGWTAWSELRYSTFKMSKAGQFVSHYVGDTEVVDSPEPVIHATLRYNGTKVAGASNTTFIVQAYSGNNMLKAPTATYAVKPGTTETRTYYLGMQEDRVLHGTFTPGFVQTQKGSLALQFAFIQPSDTYAWRVTTDGSVREYSGSYAELREAILRYGNSLEVAALSFQWGDVNGGVSATDGTRNALTMAIDSNTQKGHLLVDMEIVGDIDCTTGDFTFDLSKLAGHTFTDSSIPSSQCFYRIVYNVKLPTMQNKKLSLSLGKPTSGALVEGMTAFTAFIDLDGNGAFTPDVEPFGFVKNIDVGWDNVPELVIEMTDASAAAGKRFAYPASTNAVRIIRTAVNGKETLENGEPVKRRIVYNRDATTTERTSVHEGDLVTAGRFGLDWANLRADVEAMTGLDPKSVLSVTYTVTSGGASVMNIDPTNVVDVFTVSFPAEQSKPTSVSPSALSGPKVETQRPTFKWTGTEDNTAFILQILNTDDTPVYTSPLQVLPARDATGAYVWTAPVYVSTNASADAWSLGNNSNYNWRVAMFSPKFSNTNLETAVWSDVATFTNCLAEGGSRTSAYGAADVQVRYFGPATNDLTNVVVQLFKTADFTSEPAAQSRLEKVDGTVTNLVETGYGVRFLGLAEGTYYAIAYIDRNGDCVRQRSESWGYANQVGTGVEELYTPVEVKIVSKSGTVPSVELFMEDTDVNKNDIPDCLDDEAILTAASAAVGADTTDVDGDGLMADEETSETYTNPSLWDSDGDGMPDGWEALFAETDPLTPDAGTVITNKEVMAYVEETWKLVTDKTGGVKFLVNPTNVTVRVGDDIPLARLVTTYEYPVFENGEIKSKQGVGVPLLDDATMFHVYKIENVIAVRVHAQVYEKYGYNPLTAVPVDGAVNTKPFTALDKYLLIRYFEALGLCNEAYVNSTGAWASFSLRPNDADNDRDGVLDGWELYVMFGTNDVMSAATAKISPFDYDDARNDAPDGGGLWVIEEFDGGNSPTDPWQTTTEGFTGLPDEIAYKFRIKSDADLLADPDNDGLSNWAEYLASVLTGEDFDVNDPCSVTPNRLDYFFQFQNPNDPDGVVKYIGESIDADYLGLIADHDFMEDVDEDTLGYNRYVYDANIDYDGNGWDNWSEVRARYNEATWVVTGVSTNTHTQEFRSDNPENFAKWRMWYNNYYIPRILKMTIVSVKYYSNVDNREVQFDDRDPEPRSGYRCKVTWYELEDKMSYGGKPLPNVNFTIYGIDAGETNVTIAAYTDKNLLTPNATLDRNGKILSGSLKQGLNTFIVTSGAKVGFAKANVGFDRVDVEIALRADAIAFTVPAQSNATTRVRVQRTAINGTSFAKPRTVYAKTIDLRNGKTFTEADLLKDGEYDFDQTYLVADALAAGVAAADIRSVNYAVYLDWGSAEPIYTFTRTFPAKLVAPAPSGATGHHGNVVEAARPTLVWQAPEGASAFMLEVAKDDAFSEIIYATTNFMPIATAEGCQFKPDLYVGDGLDDATNYYWRVASVDAVTNSDWSAVATFRTAVNVENADTGYGRIAAEVRYFGPSPATLSDVVVGVYESADFTSEPVARKRLVGGDSVSTLTNDLTKAFDVVSTNIVLDGIAPGNYYLMAFIDTNTNNVRDAWESWGYVNKIGTEAVDLYTPAALKVKSTKAMPPTAFLVMEDTDINQNWTPDCLEEAALDGWIPASQIEPEEPVAADTDTDGDGLSDAEEDDYGTDPKNPDTDGDGLPDGFEVQAGSDPLFADSNLAGANDVMAYKADTLKVMFTTNDVGEVTGRYVVNSRFEDGYAEQSNTVYTVFEVGGQLFVGAPTNRADVTSAYAYAFMTNVVVMHSAVYDFYGYDPTTAKPVTAAAAATVATDSTDSTNETATATATSAFGVNTVPFTAYLKYVTQQYYLKEFGDATNDFALAVNKLDSNANYLPDGYELYVRYAMWHDADNAYGDADARASYGDNIAQLPFDPYDDYYFYNYLKKQNPGLAATLPPFDNATAFDLGAVGAGGFAGASEDWWNWAPADDYMAYVQTNVLVSVVTNADGEASIYAIDPGTNTLYETFYVGNELFVGAVCTNEYAYDAMENGEFMTMVTNATVIHSAVYDWYGFDPTTAKPSYFWPESIAYLAESNSNYTVGANSAPFTRRMKLITQMMYLPQVGAEDDYNLTTWWTDTNGNDMPDGWELYVKYTASSDPNKPDDDYKGDFDDGSDPNADDTDGDGIPDDVEQFFGVTDPLVKDADTVLANDVMAFANVNATVVTVQNTAEGSLPVKYLLAEEMAGNTVAAPKVGDDAASLALRATYEYLVTRADGLATNVCGVSTNVMLTAADGTTNRVVAVGVEPVVLVHAQVYDYFGFNPNTANTTAYAAGNAENTKLFTALDKYLVVRYLEAYDLAVATNDWKTLSLDPATSDGDADGVPDGWELYVMFGTEGITETIDAAKISPFNFDDARALAPAGDVTVIEKWNNGAPAYDPWSKDTNGNGIPDADEIKNGLSDLYGDSDNDQLPNFTEYLIGAGFTNYFDNVAGISATNNHSLASLVTDYFRRIGKLYLGEMFTDHDFMEDLWEDRFDVTKVTRGLYDPWRDSDGDGWSNYAECRAGTNPELEANTYGMKGMVVKNYPIPTIHAKVMMGPGEGKLNGTIVVQAFSDTSKLTGLPDAIWTMPVGASSENSASGTSSSGSSSSDSGNNSAKTKYLGANPSGQVSFTLSPGFVKPGSISMSFLDPGFASIDTNGVITALGNVNTAEWQSIVKDSPVTDMMIGKILASTPTNSLEIGTVDYHTGLMTVDYTKLPAVWPVVGEGNDATNSVLLHLANSYVNVSWEAEIASGNPWMTLHLTESDNTTSEQANFGHVREGTNTFVVFVADEGGTWKPGAPYGVAQGVDVGWSEASFTVELTRTTPIMARFDLVSAIGGGSSGGSGTGDDSTDRGSVNSLMGYYKNESSKYPGTNMPSNVNSPTRVRVVRNWINRTDAAADVLLDRTFDLSVHPFLTEADLLAEGVYDLDWGTLLPAYGAGARTLTNATYRVVIGDGEVGSVEKLGNNLPVLFSNRFEYRLQQTPTVPDAELAGIEYAGRPTFRWSHTNSIDKAYPAFQLRIYTSENKSASSLIYDSGVRRAPARDEKGMYEWTAPVYAGMVTSNNKVFTTTNNYYWAVSMLDAKFTTFSSDEKATPFRLGTSGNLFDGKEYGSIAVCVKYFGPLAESLSAVPTTQKNLVRVQAFTSPDFSGLPVGETYVTNVADIASETVISTNAIITGVAQGRSYYVRAYIDTDASGTKSDWESWGYACWVGDPDVKSVWTPKPVTVSYTDMAPVVTVFIEDADTENDGFPDAWEMNKNGSLTTQGPISGDTFFTAVNPNLEAALNAYDKVASVFEGSGAATTLRGLPRLRSSSPQMAELLAGEESDLPQEATSVQIKSFSLEGGLELEVVNKTTAGASSAITFNDTADVQLSLACATTPDFADAVEVPIKTITIKANNTTDGDGVAVTADELATARAKAPEARFFKAILKKQ